jgi:hypothetical protein
MFVGLIDTRDQRPDPVGPEPLWLDLPELRPWRWYVATIACFVLADQITGWPSLIPLFAAFACFFYAIASYYEGNDGLSKFRQ